MNTVQTKRSDLTLGEKEQELAALTAPLATFDLKAEINRLREDEHWLKDGRISKTLIKYSDFRIVLVLMRSGTMMQEHKADARISIHALDGRLQIQLPEKTVDLSGGQLLVLEKALPHNVRALGDSAFLLSISWPHGDAQ